ncbi:MAG: hypothetical protein H0U10_10465 [Chloroflexia bacterium]|nr:hypothetical protein [Chloroflexia bacterium]
MGLNEAEDLERTGRFRVGAAGYLEGKWFAVSLEEAIRWGTLMPPVARPRPFRVATIDVPAARLVEFSFVPRLDGIGPAYFVHVDQLAILNASGPIIVLDPIYQREPR